MIENAFFRQLYDFLEDGRSALFLTGLSGPLIAQHAFLCGKTLAVQQETLRPLWEQILAGPDQENPCPAVIQAQGCRVLLERLTARQQLILCGGGHVAQPLAKIAALLDFDITVIDDRAEFVNTDRFPDAKQMICRPFEEAMRQIPHGENCYYVIVTSGHIADRLCLTAVLGHPFGYIGVIGSRKKAALMREELLRQGFAPALLDRVHSPIGLSIGARTPAEIAVAIAGELTKVRSGVTDGGFDRAGLAQLMQGKPMVLATIVHKEGSAPRGTGAKLLTDETGALYGTIGGGAAEAEVLCAAKQVLAQNAPRLLSFVMHNEDAKKAGMVCGGSIEVLLEPLNTL